MSETPIFESEKHFIKQRRRRTLIIILSAALILAAAAAAVFAVKCSVTSYTGGEDLPFSYSWRQMTNGSAMLSVKREGELVWRVTDAGEEYGTVEIAPAGTGKDFSEFKLTPKEEGRSIARIVLGESEGTAGDKYRMELMLEAYTEGGRLCCRVLSASCKALNTAEVTDGAFPYRIFLDEDDDLVIEIPSEETDWDCVFTNENAASMIGLVYDEGVVRVFLRAGNEVGSSELKISSPYEGWELTVVLSLDEKGEFVVLQEAASAFEPEEKPDTELITITPAETQNP